MANIAIIPARSGSKGLKDKNIKEINGKPLIAYAIEEAIKSEKFDVVHVSTDSKVYAEISRKYGADVPFLRSEEMASDTAYSWDVVDEVLRRYKETSGREFKSLTLLQPTSPMRKASDIISAYEIYDKYNANAIYGVCEADHSPLIFHPLEENGDMCHFQETVNLGYRRQGFEKFYRVNGAIYIMRTSYFEEDRRNIFRDKVYAYIMDAQSSIDIDNQLDFDIAEFLMSRRVD